MSRTPGGRYQRKGSTSLRLGSKALTAGLEHGLLFQPKSVSPLLNSVGVFPGLISPTLK